MFGGITPGAVTRASSGGPYHYSFGIHRYMAWEIPGQAAKGARAGNTAPNLNAATP
jgi:hypothetical protein